MDEERIAWYDGERRCVVFTEERRSLVALWIAALACKRWQDCVVIKSTAKKCGKQPGYMFTFHRDPNKPQAYVPLPGPPKPKTALEPDPAKLLPRSVVLPKLIIPPRADPEHIDVELV